MTRKARSRRAPASQRRHKGKDPRQGKNNQHGRSPARERDRQLLQLEDKIVGFIYSKGGQASRKEISEGLQLPTRGRRKDLEQILKALCLGKTLSCKGDIFRNHNVKNLVEATISSNPRGFAFARPVSETKDTRENDIFIPPGSTATANHGDRALIRLTKGRRDKQEGRAPVNKQLWSRVVLVRN